MQFYDANLHWNLKNGSGSEYLWPLLVSTFKSRACTQHEWPHTLAIHRTHGWAGSPHPQKVSGWVLISDQITFTWKNTDLSIQVHRFIDSLFSSSFIYIMFVCLSLWCIYLPIYHFMYLCTKFETIFIRAGIHIYSSLSIYLYVHTP